MGFYDFESYEDFTKLDFIIEFKKQIRLLSPINRLIYIISFINDYKHDLKKYHHVYLAYEHFQKSKIEFLINSDKRVIATILNKKTGKKISTKTPKKTLKKFEIPNEASGIFKDFNDFLNFLTENFSKTILKIYEHNRILEYKKLIEQKSPIIKNNNELALISPLIMNWSVWTEVIQYEFNQLKKEEFDSEKTRLLSLLKELEFRLDNQLFPKLIKSNPILNDKHPNNPYLFTNINDGDSIIVDNPAYLDKEIVNEISYNNIDVDKYKKFIRELTYIESPKKIKINKPYTINQAQSIINYFFENYFKSIGFNYKIILFSLNKDNTEPNKESISKDELIEVCSIFLYLREKKLLGFFKSSIAKRIYQHYEVGISVGAILKSYLLKHQLSDKIKRDIDKIISQKK